MRLDAAQGHAYRVAFIAAIYDKSPRLNSTLVVKQRALLSPTLDTDVVAGSGGGERTAVLSFIVVVIVVV